LSNFWQAKISFVVLSLIALGLGTPLQLIAPSTAADKALKVIFPSDYSVGKLTLLNENWQPVGPHPHGPSFGEARGTLLLPAHKLLMIRFESTMADHPDALNQMPADAITFLDLQGTGVEDNVVLAMQKVKNLESLRRIDFTDTDVTDVSMSAVARFKRLESLNFQSTAVRGTATGALAQLPKLISLHLGSNNLEPQTFDRLAKLDNLQELNLARTGFDDRAAAKLSTMKNLQKLVVSFLQKLPRLEHLDLRSTAVSAGGIKKLQANKSLCSITLNKGQFGIKTEENLKATVRSINFSFDDRERNRNADLFAPLK